MINGNYNETLVSCCVTGNNRGQKAISSVPNTSLFQLQGRIVSENKTKEKRKYRLNKLTTSFVFNYKLHVNYFQLG